MKNNLAIVLTATIIPNAVKTVYEDFASRRQQYLNAIDFYREYGTVYFLENSSYDLMQDECFFKYDNVHIRKFKPSEFKKKGKGFQEFEMLDNWLNTENSPPLCWIKISGRYLIIDFDKIFTECSNESQYGLLIEQKIPPSTVALTDVFYVTSEFYRRFFIGAYLLSDDSNNIYIEHVIRKKIYGSQECRLFREMPMIKGISGSTGDLINISLRKKLKRAIGKIMYIFSHKYRFI